MTLSLQSCVPNSNQVHSNLKLFGDKTSVVVDNKQVEAYNIECWTTTSGIRRFLPNRYFWVPSIDTVVKANSDLDTDCRPVPQYVPGKVNLKYIQSGPGPNKSLALKEDLIRQRWMRQFGLASEDKKVSNVRHATAKSNEFIRVSLTNTEAEDYFLWRASKNDTRFGRNIIDVKEVL